MEPVIVPIEDAIDLHTFNPKEVPDLLDDYFQACIQAGIYFVRVIHGKGRGILRKRVQSILQKNPQVASFRDAPPEAGGWGATLVALTPKM